MAMLAIVDHPAEVTAQRGGPQVAGGTLLEDGDHAALPASHPSAMN